MGGAATVWATVEVDVFIPPLVSIGGALFYLYVDIFRKKVAPQSAQALTDRAVAANQSLGFVFNCEANIAAVAAGFNHVYSLMVRCIQGLIN